MAAAATATTKPTSSHHHHPATSSDSLGVVSSAGAAAAGAAGSAFSVGEIVVDVGSGTLGDGSGDADRSGDLEGSGCAEGFGACDCDSSGVAAGAEREGSSSVAGGSVRIDVLVGLGSDAVTLVEADKDRDASP
jgi:hypothetical protein